MDTEKANHNSTNVFEPLGFPSAILGLRIIHGVIYEFMALFYISLNNQNVRNYISAFESKMQASNFNDRD